MNVEKYENLLNDNSVLKGWGNFVEHFLIPNEEIIIQFMFMYLGMDSNGLNSLPKKRINLHTFPKANLIDEIQPRLINQKTIILANAESQYYAISFELLVEQEKRTISVILLDEPYLGGKLITKEEKYGIIIKYY